jgi:hypothetical protein
MWLKRTAAEVRGIFAYTAQNTGLRKMPEGPIPSGFFVKTSETINADGASCRE